MPLAEFGGSLQTQLEWARAAEGASNSSGASVPSGASPGVSHTSCTHLVTPLVILKCVLSLPLKIYAKHGWHVNNSVLPQRGLSFFAPCNYSNPNCALLLHTLLSLVQASIYLFQR